MRQLARHSCSLGSVPDVGELYFVETENLEPISGGVGEVVGGRIEEGVRVESEGAADAASSTVAGGEDIDVGVTDHNGFGGRDRVAV